MKPEQVQALRKPFPAERIQSLPQGGTKLDYVSHAWVTDRLLEVDPTWSWKPVAFGADGLPKFDENGGLWIELTVCGVTRLGYGEPQGRDKYDQVKGAIGNAIRTAAMRFGVALDLWARENATAPKPVTKGKVERASNRLVEVQPEAVGLDTESVIKNAYALITDATTADELRVIWKNHAELLDVEQGGTTIRKYATARKDELV